MKKILILTSVFCMLTSLLQAQDINKIINAKEVEKIEKVLSSNKMRGRKTFTPDIDRAADFIASEFKKTGLQYWNGLNSYKQEFFMLESSNASAVVKIDGQTIADSLIAVSSFQPKVSLSEKNTEVLIVSSSDDFRKKYSEALSSKKNLLVLVDAAYSSFAKRLKSRPQSKFEQPENSIVFVFGVSAATHFSIELTNNINKKPLSNVVGILPGKSKPNEYVIFSGHYDHLGVGKPVNGDSIYNGANDDAAGTTAVIMLAKYYKKLNNNERTLIFVTFTAEEIGGFGAQYFSKQFNPEQVMAMFNIEMIGTESKWGKNSAYITGYEKTDMGKILQSNLEGSGFTFYPDPYTTQNLFYRSDNATLARLGVPAHTISTSKMDSEPNYHKVSDEIETLDMNNMAEIIKSIAISAEGIISGKQTPTRVDTKNLR
ncbi:MAG: M20/M25/M40 family metallo-hydrolase [Bacteroidetes bacterium]|nr:M20/M25/M40 family metallo-hydrolase [Bacteroidota bacterium]MBS1641050.1 M20/M25/M40 family metallo-hydrolase [Bacteroidota bacterium]MBS1672085.1 M20/M25/M40 family metallo-hydrolase [Bacteroidota bacterium]